MSNNLSAFFKAVADDNEQNLKTICNLDQTVQITSLKKEKKVLQNLVLKKQNQIDFAASI